MEGQRKRDSLHRAQIRDVAFQRVITQYKVSTPVLKADLDICELILDCAHPYFDFLILHSRGQVRRSDPERNHSTCDKATL
jgi:hypothetical protein